LLTTLEESVKQKQEISQLKDECYALQQQIEYLKTQAQQVAGTSTTPDQSDVASSPTMASVLLDLNAPNREAEK